MSFSETLGIKLALLSEVDEIAKAGMDRLVKKYYLLNGDFGLRILVAKRWCLQRFIDPVIRDLILSSLFSTSTTSDCLPFYRRIILQAGVSAYSDQNQIDAANIFVKFMGATSYLKNDLSVKSILCHRLLVTFERYASLEENWELFWKYAEKLDDLVVIYGSNARLE